MNEMFQIPAPQDKVNILASDAMHTRGHVCHNRQKCGLCSNFHAICNYLSAIMDGVTGRRGVMEEAGREIKPII